MLLAPPSATPRAFPSARRRSRYWYFLRAGGLTTPAIWPEAVSTKRTGPPKKAEPTKTDFAGAM